MQAETAVLETSTLVNRVPIKPIKNTAAQIIFMGKKAPGAGHKMDRKEAKVAGGRHCTIF